jgi:hypothetical protein
MSSSSASFAAFRNLIPGQVALHLGMIAIIAGVSTLHFHEVRTIYTTIGDLFARVFLVGLVILTGIGTF